MRGTAARWANWERRRGGSPAGPLGGSDVDITTFNPKVEIFVDEAWVDITRLSNDEAGVYYRDRITVTRGRSDESSQADPQTCTFTINNRDGRFSPNNPMSPYYGKIGRNTRCRISVMRNGVRRYRFYGEISAWPTKWDIGGNDVYTTIVASGIKRRIVANSSPIRSPMYRTFSSGLPGIEAYWPAEEAGGATSVASAFSDVPSMTVKGTPTFAAFSDWKASGPLPTMGTASFEGKVPAYPTPASLGKTDQFVFRTFVNVNSAVSGEQVLFQIYTSGGLDHTNVFLDDGGAMAVQTWDNNGNITANTNGFYVAFGMNSAGMTLVKLEMGVGIGSGTPSNHTGFELVRYDLSNDLTIADPVPSVLISGDLGSIFSVGRVTKVVINTLKGLGDVAMGHFTVGSTHDTATINSGPLKSAAAIEAYSNEATLDRLVRLYQEESVPLVISDGTLTGSDETMSWQTSDTLVNLGEQCTAIDLGIMFETRDQLSFKYRTRTSLYNQESALALDYEDSNLADSLDPVYDDQNITNDIALSREGGSSVRLSQIDGPMSVNDPPNGVGRYQDAPPAINIGSDDQLTNQAAWRLRLGTVDESRFPTITLQLAHPSFTENVDLMNQALTFDIGDRITIDNPPEWMPPEQISQLVQGYTETFDQLTYDMTLNCSPESPYRVAVSDDTEMRADTGGSVLASDISSSDASIGVTTTGTQRWIDSATYASEFPFDISVGGERMAVTAITGTTTSQTFTVTRSVNGIIKAHSAGDTVSLSQKTYVGL